MRSARYFYALLLLGSVFTCMLLLSACEKNEVVVIGDNIAPPDSTIPNIVYEQYVNQTYVALTGQEPTEAQRQTALQLLYSDGLGTNSRQSMVDGIQQTDNYKRNFFTQYNEQLLNSYDSTELERDIFVFGGLLQDSAYQAFWPQIQEAYDDLLRLKQTPSNLIAGSIDQKTFYRYMIDNARYDDINMGTENFVLSSFDHFMLRYPTTAELAEASNMVDGQNAILFLTEGSSKNDYLDIFFASDEYYQSQVIVLYRRFLFRDPTSEEVSDHAAYYKGTQNYDGLVKRIVTTNEYAGLD